MSRTATREEAESLLEAAREVNLDLPKGKKTSVSEAKAALEGAIQDDEFDQKAALKALEDKFGVKKGRKRKAAAPRPASKKEGPSAKTPSELEEEWDVSDKAKRKELAEKLAGLAKSRGIKMPEDEDQMRMGAGRAIMGVKTEEGKASVREALNELSRSYGVDPSWVDTGAEEGTHPRKKAKSKAAPTVCPENEPLANLFKELADFYFKEGSKAGMVYQKVVTAIKNLDYVLTEPPKKKQIPGIGDKTIAKIKEYLETGTIQLLEEKRAEKNEI
ncbi:unnamed protein product [Discosporangium mesarthrocarpum]